MIECFELKKAVRTVFICCGSLSHRWFRYLLVLCIAISLSMALSGCGCWRKKKQLSGELTAQGIPVEVSRMNDPSYIAVLNQHGDEQKVVARERTELGDKMKACAERVKAGLASDVSEEDFKAALEKDEEWQSYQEPQDALDQKVKDSLRDARETVRARLVQEQLDAAALAK